MRCALNRWGPGTPCERPNNTENAKELQDKLTKMRSERTEQDKMWEETEKTPVKQEPQPQQQTQINKKIYVRDNILYNS